MRPTVGYKELSEWRKEARKAMGEQAAEARALMDILTGGVDRIEIPKKRALKERTSRWDSGRDGGEYDFIDLLSHAEILRLRSTWLTYVAAPSHKPSLLARQVGNKGLRIDELACGAGSGIDLQTWADGWLQCTRIIDAYDAICKRRPFNPNAFGGHGLSDLFSYTLDLDQLFSTDRNAACAYLDEFLSLPDRETLDKYYDLTLTLDFGGTSPRGVDKLPPDIAMNLKYVADELEQLSARRDELVRVAYDAGAPVRVIGAFAHLSPQTVINIAKRTNKKLPA